MPTAEVATSLFSSLSPPALPCPALAEQKRVLRQQARLVRRAALERQGSDAAAAVCRLVLAEPRLLAPFGPGAVVAGYWPVGSELDDRPLLAALVAAGWRVALPVVEQAEQPLIFRAWQPDQPLVTGRYGIHEPAAGAEVLIPDVVLVPLLAFDRACGRLGQGGGFYDRTLAWLRPTRPLRAIGLGFAAQAVAELPAGPYDQALDAVVSEIGIQPAFPA